MSEDSNEVSPENKNNNAVSSESPVDGGDGGSNISVDVVNIGEDRIPIYWESPEAAKLFGFNYEEGEDVYYGLKERVEVLR